MPTDRPTLLREAAASGMTLQQVGDILGVTRERARQLFEQYELNDLRKSARQEVLYQRYLHGRVSPLRRLVVEALRARGYIVTEELREYGVTFYLDTHRIRFRVARHAYQLAPNSQARYYRGAFVRDPDAAYVLVTGRGDIYGWTPPHAKRYLYVRADKPAERWRDGRPPAKPDIVLRGVLRGQVGETADT